MRHVLSDLRYASRMLRHFPGFTAVAVLVVALGIGANTAMFTVVDAVLLRGLPFPEPERLMMLWERTPTGTHNRVSPLNFIDWNEQNHAFAAVAAVAGGDRTLTGTSAEPEMIGGQAVTSRFFDVLGVVPIAGRTFTPADDVSKTPSVVISERLWKRRFGSDPSLVGRTLTLDGRSWTVVGIVPADFQILFRADLWTLYVPLRSPEQRRMHYMQVLGRPKPGVTLQQARSDMESVAADISRVAPDTNKDWSVSIEPLQQALVTSELRTTTFVLAGVVGFVLLIASANIASLLLARGIGRTREIAVRAALGGSRARIVSQLITESVLLAALGGAAGMSLAWAAVKAAPTLMPPGTLPQSIVLAFDLRVALFACALTLVTGVAFGLAPAWQALRVPLSEAIGTGGRAATHAAGSFRTVLVVCEIAAALVLIAGAGLLTRTLTSLNSVDPGFHATRVLTMRVILPLSRYPSLESTGTFYQRVEQEVAALPGVQVAALGGSLPLDGWDIGQGFTIVGDPPVEESHRKGAHYQIVSTRYFEALGIPIVRGRAFTDQDSASSLPVCVVNEEFAHRYLRGRDPLTVQVNVQSMNMKGPTPVVRQIVGVSRQVKVEGPGEKENALEIYVPIAQNPWFAASLIVKAAVEPAALVPAIKASIARVDPELPVTRVRTMEEVADQATARPRFRARLVAGFAALALVLAAVGIFGVLASSVSQRLREFGIRMALGAQSGDVLRLVLASGVKITAAGTTIGLAGASLLTRSMGSLLFGVAPLDAVTFVVAPILLGTTALIACAVPALRAATIGPAAALRHE